ALRAATRSSASVRLTPTIRSMNCTPPACRTRTRSTATTLGTRATMAVILAAPPAGDADEQRHDDGRGGVRPGIAERDGGEPGEDRDRGPHVGAEMQRIRLERLARGLAGDPVEHAGAKEIDHDRAADHHERPRRRLDRVAAARQSLQRL